MGAVEDAWVQTDDGEKLRAWAAGPPGAEPLLLISGGGSESRAWRFLVPDLCDDDFDRAYAAAEGSALTDSLRVAGYDQRGTGASSGQVPPDSARLAAEHAWQVGRAVLGERFHVLGHSLGGMAALQLALARPEAVASLILMSTTAGGAGLTMPDAEFVANFAGQGEEDPLERARANYKLSVSAAYPGRHPDMFERQVAWVASHPGTPESSIAQAMTFATHDVVDQLEDLAPPTLVICGTEDRVMPIENSRFLAAGIPGAQLAELEEAGHALDLEAVARVAAEVSEFVAAHPLG